MLTQTFGTHDGYANIADLDAAIARERDTLRPGPDIKASTALCTALRYRFLLMHRQSHFPVGPPQEYARP